MKMRKLMSLVESSSEQELDLNYQEARRNLDIATAAVRAAESDPDFSGSLRDLDVARDMARQAFNEAEDAISRFFAPLIDSASTVEEAQAVLDRVPRSVTKAFLYDRARQKGLSV